MDAKEACVRNALANVIAAMHRFAVTVIGFVGNVNPRNNGVMPVGNRITVGVATPTYAGSARRFVDTVKKCTVLSVSTHVGD